MNILNAHKGLTGYGDYLSYVRGIIFTRLSGIRDDDDFSLWDVTENKKAMSIEVIFNDGSKFDAFNTIDVNQGNVNKYSYNYTRPSGFFFSYHMDSISYTTTNGELSCPKEPIEKPNYHLHVGVDKHMSSGISDDLNTSLYSHKGPHYITCYVPIDYVLAVIIVNYFPDQTDCLEGFQLDYNLLFNL